MAKQAFHRTGGHIKQAWVKAIVWETKKDYICGLY